MLNVQLVQQVQQVQQAQLVQVDRQVPEHLHSLVDQGTSQQVCNVNVYTKRE